jgi:molybdate transport system substrate-binding protein
MRRAAGLTAVAIAIAIAPAAAGCGGSGDSGGGHPQLIVSAASSLRDAFTAYGDTFKPARVRLAFGGSDELAAQIRAGGKVDVFAAANAKLPDQLHAEGKAGLPVIFTANRLVLAVPAGSSRVKSLDDVATPGVKVAIGAKDVPVGGYTRQVLAVLPVLERDRILSNVKTEEPDVAGIVGKLTQGAVDAGFVYATDVVGAKGALKAIALPGGLRPKVEYEVAVVTGTKHKAQAQAFVDGLRRGAGQAALRKAGFLPVAG